METARTPPPPRPRVSGTVSQVLSFRPPSPAESLSLQPRSCIAPWRPSSALSQVPKCKGGLPAANSPRGRGTYPEARSFF